MSGIEEEYSKTLDKILDALEKIANSKRNRAVKILTLKKFDEDLSNYLDTHREIMLYLIAKGLVAGELIYYIQQGKKVPTKTVEMAINYLKKMIEALKEQDICKLASIITEDGLDIISGIKPFKKKKAD